MDAVKLGKKGQVSLPAAVLRKLGLVARRRCSSKRPTMAR